MLQAFTNLFHIGVLPSAVLLNAAMLAFALLEKRETALAAQKPS